MIDDELKIVALALIVVMGVVAVYPILNSMQTIEPFSELGVLGPNGNLGDYPKQVAVNQSFNLFIYVNNNEGRSQYYRVQAKLGDQASNPNNLTPLDVTPFASWEVILMNGQNSSLPVTMTLNEPGLNKKLVFELQAYNTETGNFVYNQRWVQLWMNVTTTP